MELREAEYCTFENLGWGSEDSNDSSFPILNKLFDISNEEGLAVMDCLVTLAGPLAFWLHVPGRHGLGVHLLRFRGS